MRNSVIFIYLGFKVIISVILCNTVNSTQQLKSTLASRKPLHPENNKHVDEDDTCSVASSYPCLSPRILIVVIFYYDSYFLLLLFFQFLFLHNLKFLHGIYP